MIRSAEQKANEVFNRLNKKMNSYFLTDDEIKYVHWLATVNDEQWHEVLIGILNKIPGKAERDTKVVSEKLVSDITRTDNGVLLHTISVECSYHEYKDASEHDAVSFVARTEGEMNGEKVNDLDYNVHASLEDARGFARYILSLCDQIESEME